MLTAEAISYTTAGARLIKDISLTVKPGEVLAIIGPNGAGKSTFLQLLSGALKPSAGQIMLEGQELARCSRQDYARRRAVMSQRVHIDFPFTAFEVVLLGRSPHLRGAGNDQAIALAAMQRAGVAELTMRIYATLSGGEQQRIQFARALTQIWRAEPARPRYLLLDEPVAGMDPAHQHSTLQIAGQFSRQQVGVVAVLHDLNLAAMYADRIAVFHQGALYRCGAPAAVLTGVLIKEVFRLDTTLQAHPSRNCCVVIPTPA